MERGKNECKRGTWIIEVKRDGTITGITEESRRVCFVQRELKGEENARRADEREPGKLELILRFESEFHAKLI